MEIGLKERLIGAIVLVILAVIIIPWVLKGGSAPDSSVTQSLTLPPAAATRGQAAYQMDLNNPAVVTSVSPPVTASTHPVSANTATPPVVKAAPVAQAPIHAAPKAAATGAWVVQAGSYSNEANARSVQSKLVKQGFHAYISRFHKGSHTYYRVRVGPYTDRAAAEHAVSRVGHAFDGKAVVVPNS